MFKNRSLRSKIFSLKKKEISMFWNALSSLKHFSDYSSAHGSPFNKPYSFD